MTKKEREEILKEIDYITGSLWEEIATAHIAAEDMMEKMDLLMRHLRTLRDELQPPKISSSAPLENKP